MRFNNFVIVVSVFSLLAACEDQSQAPTTYVSPLEFKQYNCNQISKEMAHTSQMLEKHKEEMAAENVAGAAIAIWAVSQGHGVSFGDDDETLRLKSKYEALHQAGIQKNCD